MSAGAARVGARVRPAYLALLAGAIAIAAVAGAYTWRHHSHQDSARLAVARSATAAALAHATVSAPLTSDRTYTGCFGEGELCAISDAGVTPMLSALRQQLNRLGISTESPRCDVQGLPWQAQCQVVGHHDGATLRIYAGAHNTRYWARADWAMVTVEEPDGATFRPIAMRSDPVARQHLAADLPAAWTVTPCQPVNGETCSRMSISVPGTVEAASEQLAQRLVKLGFGVGPFGDRSAVCQNAPGQPRSCRFVAIRFAVDASGSVHESQVMLRLDQTSAGAGTGSVGALGAF